MTAAGLESAAVSVLKDAVALDNQNRFTEAVVSYRQGLQLLFNLLRVTTNEAKKKHLRAKMEEYMTRAESIKALIEEQKALGKYHEQIHIENDSKGHSYESMFSRFLDDDVTSVEVEDPYIRSFHQCQNFLRFCELLVKSCKNLTNVTLLTSSDGSRKDQAQFLDNMQQSLQKCRINLIIQYSGTLHDRQIKLSTGWTIKIGRGLDYFKAPESKFAIGYFDLNLRPCHETTVDIFHVKDVKISYG